MGTWAQIVNNVAYDVVSGPSLSECIVEGYAPHGVAWTEIPDGTLSGATTNDGVHFTNPVLPAPPPPAPDPIAVLQAQVSTLQAQVNALAGAISPAAATAVQAVPAVSP